MGFTGSRRARALLAAAGVTAVGLATIGGIAAARDTRMNVSLSGAQEVPVADPDGTGRTTITVDEATGEVCFRISFNRTGTPNRGHIHVGVAGTNGVIVVPLFELVGLPGDADNDDLEQNRLEGCVTTSLETAAAIAADPTGYYVNLHNARYPTGAIRGQLGR